MEIPKVGDKLYLQKNTGYYYVDMVKTPYTVISVENNKVKIQECKLVPPVYHCVGNPALDRPDLEGQRVWFFDTVAESIEEDPHGKVKTLVWSNKYELWRDSEDSSKNTNFAHFGEWKHQPYLN